MKHQESAWLNKYYTRKEELANSITHGFGAFLSIIGLIVLITYGVTHGDVWRIVSFSIYGATLLALYSASTLYHSIHNPRFKSWLQKLDHACIYLLIAGTYTPFLLVTLRDSVGWTMMAVVWGVAAIGIGFKTLVDAERFQIISTLAYVGMGWLCVIYWGEMMASVPTTGLIWLAAGGVTYTAGVLFYALNRIPYNHAVWHLFVLGGSACHYVAMFYLVPTAA